MAESFMDLWTNEYPWICNKIYLSTSSKGKREHTILRILGDF